ncbi:MAG TPA: hypothetical protein VN905_11285 [Candidatus Binatia bacterium]|nr:hypothetical protein [Candidatus Binatia bacterium]
MCVDAFPRLGARGRFYRGKDDDEKLDDGFDDARFVTSDQQRTERAGEQCRDNRRAQIAGLDRKAFAGFSQSEDDELRAEGDQEKAQLAAGAWKRAHDGGDAIATTGARTRKSNRPDRG